MNHNIAVERTEKPRTFPIFHSLCPLVSGLDNPYFDQRIDVPSRSEVPLQVRMRRKYRQRIAYSEYR